MESHPAIEFIQMGQGYGITNVPVVTLGQIGTSGTFHIVDVRDKAFVSICGTRGRFISLIEECDPKTIVWRGRPVCARCQKALGHVPMPELVRNEGGSE